jgi:peptidoglycan/LPS O-acetylase OafA/YrhL
MTAAARIAALDVGRTLAVIGVIAVHLAPWMVTSPVWLDMLANLGQYGVQCFFVISAITISASLQHDAQRLSGTREVLRNFYVKRFARIAPLYYLAIIGYTVVDYALRLVHGHIQMPHDFSDVIFNLIFIHAWVPSAIDSVVPGGWSIGVEMFFYVIAPALVFIVDHKVETTGFSRSALAAKIRRTSRGAEWNTDTAATRFFRSSTTLYGSRNTATKY